MGYTTTDMPHRRGDMISRCHKMRETLCTKERMRWAILCGLVCLGVAACPRSQLTGNGGANLDSQGELPSDVAAADGQLAIECTNGFCATDADCGGGLACEVAVCYEGCCAYELAPVGTECKAPCHSLAVCSKTGNCLGVLPVQCPELDGNPCTIPWCDASTDYCAKVEAPLPDDSLLPGSGSVCWEEAVCKDGLVAGADATALNQKCQGLDDELEPFGCVMSVSCNEVEQDCVSTIRTNGTPCLIPGGEEGDVCFGHSCATGDCVADSSFDQVCDENDYPKECDEACQECTSLACSWTVEPSADILEQLVKYCRAQALTGEACDDGHECTKGDVCTTAETKPGPAGNESFGTCSPGPYVPDDSSLTDLVLDGTSLTLSGEHTFGVVELLNGAVLYVEPYDGLPCEPNSATPGTGTLIINAAQIFLDKTSKIVGKAAGGGGEGCGEYNYPDKNDAGAGGGYGGAGGEGAKWLVDPGQPYGTQDGDDIDMGSDGSTVKRVDYACGPPGTNLGGKGGGMILISCCEAILEGTITVEGGAGGPGTNTTDLDGAGGGSGGGVLIDCLVVESSGTIDARGGQGGDAHSQGRFFCAGWGGGGGGGGRVKIFSSSVSGEGAIHVQGGIGGWTYGGQPKAGGDGTVHP
jgi:hypothetical protein